MATLAAEVLAVGRAWGLLSAGLTRAAGDWLLASSAIAVLSLAIGLWLLLARPKAGPGDRKS
jgi:hypothetical protein